MGVKLVHGMPDLMEHTSYILANFPESNLIIESFLASDDVTCGYVRLGNEILLMPSYYVIKDAPGKNSVLSRENQFRPWGNKHKRQFFVEEADILEQVKRNVPKIVKIFGVKDVTRIDGRLDVDGTLRFYDVNGFPGLRFSKSVLTRQCGLYYPRYSDMDIYDGLLNTIVFNALLRHRLPVPEALRAHNLFTMASDRVLRLSEFAN